ncbi:MAG: ATP-binding cassette domain-containing protein, partial [Flammeovirgaceae bacterium]
MMFSSDPVVRVKDASVFQEQKTVLRDINFEIDKGEFVFIIGRTGSGKSSLLKTLYADLPLRQG